MSQAHAGQGGREKGKERAPLAQDTSTAHCQTSVCACIRAQPLDHALIRQPCCDGMIAPIILECNPNARSTGGATSRLCVCIACVTTESGLRSAHRPSAAFLHHRETSIAAKMVLLRQLFAPAQPVHRWSVETHAASLTLTACSQQKLDKCYDPFLLSRILSFSHNPDRCYPLAFQWDKKQDEGLDMTMPSQKNSQRLH